VLIAMLTFSGSMDAPFVSTKPLSVGRAAVVEVVDSEVDEVEVAGKFQCI